MQQDGKFMPAICHVRFSTLPQGSQERLYKSSPTLRCNLLSPEISNQQVTIAFMALSGKATAPEQSGL